MAHTHSVTDTDIHFEIDGVTRSVKNVTETKTMLVQFDHNSERFTFKLPRYVDGHDLSLCNMVRVHYINIEKSKRTQNSGISEITDLAVCTDDQQYVTCSWLVPNTATQLAGSLHFVVQFACEENGKALYSWNTAKHTSVIVADGIDCGDAVVTENESLLTQWKNQLESNQITKIEQTVVSNEDNGENVWTVTFGDGRTQDLRVKNGSRGATGLIGSIQTLQGHILNFFVGTKDEYESLTDKDNVFAIITEGNSYVEMEYDTVAKGFKIDGAGVYLVIGYTGTDYSNSGLTGEALEAMMSLSNWFVCDTITIPMVKVYASGAKTRYYTSDVLNHMYDHEYYRITFNKEDANPIHCFKAFKIASL